MGGQVRRVRLLLAVVTAGLLALVVAWPSQGAVTEPAPRYLIRELGAGRSTPVPNQFLAVADGPRLVMHLSGDREQPANLEVIDAAGRVVVLQPDGKAAPTGAVVDTAVLQTWLSDSFKARSQALDRHVVADPGDKLCWTAEQTALSRLNLPSRNATRALTLSETYAEADRRIAAMHQPANAIPVRCITGIPSHRDGYLHNLWHRITGS